MLRVLAVIALFVSTAAEFQTDPQSVTVHEGQNVTLSCRSDVMNYGQPCYTYRFFWRLDILFATDAYITDCLSVYDQRMTVSMTDGEYSLTIRQVVSADSGEYYCYVSGNSYNSESTRADLVVLRAPPSCDVTPSSPTVGTASQLRCKLSDRDPASLLTWIETVSRNVVGSRPTEPIDPGDYYIADIPLTELDNYKEFACVSGPDLENGARCVIIPLQIKTKVLISPSPSVTVFEGQIASFTCTSESIPSANEFRWRVQKSTGSEDKVNMNTISNFGDEYTLSDKGQEIRIVHVSIVEFDNAVIKCISVNNREPVSSKETVLLVVAASDTGTTHQPTAEKTDMLGPDFRDEPANSSSTGIVVGGVLGVILLLAVIASLGCYLLRNKNGRLKQRLARSRLKKLSAKAQPTMSVVQASPTYEEVSQDAVRYQSRSSSPDVTEQPALYALPEAVMQHNTDTSGNSSPTYPNSSGYVNLPRHGEKRPLSGGATGDNRRVASGGEVKYSVLDKSRQTAHSSPPAGETTAGALRSNDHGKQKNAEGLVYAELDLEDLRPTSSVENSQHADESINYASIRGDMAAVRSLLSRD